jgi:hypothetical protein
MHSLKTWLRPVVITLLTLSGLTFPASAQNPTGALLIQVNDPANALIINADVTAVDAGGGEHKAAVNADGLYLIPRLAPGRYTLRVNAPSFAPLTAEEAEVVAGRTSSLKLALSVELERQEVSVKPESGLSTEPGDNASAIILKESDLESLPDDEEDLGKALQVLAGPSAGGEGGQFIVDGFSKAAVPPKSSIREVRINQNPFSAEYDHLGFGRIEIFTKPGTTKPHGQGFFNFSDESLNSRNPFAERRNPFQMRFFGGSLSGPIATNRASYFLDFDNRQVDDNAIINATVLDSSLNVFHLRQTVLTPQRRTNFGARLDDQLNKNNTLTARYQWSGFNIENAGVGDFSLLSKAFERSNTDQTLQVSETAVLGSTAVNVARLQYIHSQTQIDGDNTIPAVNVLDAFSGGGAQVGQSFRRTQRLEAQDFIMLARGKHTVRFGGRLRYVSLTDSSPSNFGGTYTFSGGLAPELDAANQVVLDPQTGGPALISITSIERYRRTLLFGQQGLTPEQIRALGGGAAQFSISAGNPEAHVRQYDLGLFVQDDWRVRPNLTLSAGLRYETQNNIHSPLNFAPRLSFAWGLGQRNGRPAQTVLRGGFGVYYDRLDEDWTLRARRYNGINQQQFIVPNPDFFPSIPSGSSIADAQQAQTVRPLDPNLRAPYIMQVSFGVERRLRPNTTLSATFIGTRMLHGFRSRNINAPLPGTFTPDDPESGVRPFGNIGNIFQVESSARLNQEQLVVGLNSELSEKVGFNVLYTLNQIKNDALDAGIFPANSYDLTGEYGRSALDLRHRFALSGTFRAPFGINLNPFIVAFSSRPFNITIGRDLNGDAIFAERPAFATDLSKPGVIVTRFGAFDPNPESGQRIIPRNYGNATAFFMVNVRVSKVFTFGEAGGGGSAPAPRAAAARTPQPQPGRPAPAAATAAAARPQGSGNGRPADKRYSMTFSLQVTNLLNHTNEATPVGNLSSPFFGTSLSLNGGLGFGGGGSSSAANRRLEAQVRFSF